MDNQEGLENVSKWTDLVEGTVGVVLVVLAVFLVLLFIILCRLECKVRA